MKEITKKYTNGQITIVWKPSLCIHSTRCFSGLPQVFNPQNKPWVNVEGAGTQEIIQQVDKCPSGALSYFRNDGETGENKTAAPTGTKVEVIPNGPLLVYGEILITDSQLQAQTRNKVTAFCRCGHSAKKPFCDGSHARVGFNDQAQQ